ncbi:MAG: helix-turn-helix transcriptional regulator [Ignavibacteria bacterium]|nr:helix-turn-helix transcriptional regulator [Ignavibacteria bacterium]
MENERRQRIRAFIEDVYGTYRAFALATGLSPQHVNRYVSPTLENSSPTLDTLAKFADAGMSIDWVITGLGSRFAPTVKGLEFARQFGVSLPATTAEPSITVSIPIQELRAMLDRHDDAVHK